MAGQKDARANGPKATPRPKAARKGDERDVGVALRTAYQATVEESIPAEMLDLLGKLR